MFNFSEWVVSGIIDGTQEQAEHIAVACPLPETEESEDV